MNIPHLFTCPISLDLFSDPVTLITGQTYDRSSIEKWLANGNFTCPVTMQKLHDLSLVPNRTLSHLINQWLAMEREFSPEGKNFFNLESSLLTFKENLQSINTITFDKQLETIRKINLLSQESSSTRYSMIQLGFFPIILKLAFDDLVGESNICSEVLEFREETLCCALYLLQSVELGCLNLLKKMPFLSSFAILLTRGSTKMKILLCHLVGKLSISSDTEELCCMIGDSGIVLQKLLYLLHEKNEKDVSESGARAICALCSQESNCVKVLSGGGIVSLFLYLSVEDGRDASKALAAIHLLLKLEMGKRAAIGYQHSVRILVKMVFRVSNKKGSENALNSLMILCKHSCNIAEEAIDEGILTQILLLLQSQCNSESKKKASDLLKLLRSKWVDIPNNCNL